MQAAIFDMDGTLIDSEPLWKEAERQIFTSVGVPVTAELAALTATMTTREVTQFWYLHSPWEGKSLEQVEHEVIDRVGVLITEQGQALEGVVDILTFLQSKQLKIGLATNSPSKLIKLVLSKLGIEAFFDAISSSEHEVSGKPHPAVYLSTARKLQVEPSRCIAFEDSTSGLMAAHHANLKTVAIPSAENFSDQKFDISHLKLQRLSQFSAPHLDMLARA